MDFDLTDEERRWRALARDFAQGTIRPRAEELDREQRFPYDIIAEMAHLGLLGLTLPEEYGGSGGDFISYCLAIEEISRADTSVGITMEAHVSAFSTTTISKSQATSKSRGPRRPDCRSLIDPYTRPRGSSSNMGSPAGGRASCTSKPRPSTATADGSSTAPRSTSPTPAPTSPPA